MVQFSDTASVNKLKDTIKMAWCTELTVELWQNIKDDQISDKMFTKVHQIQKTQGKIK